MTWTSKTPLGQHFLLDPGIVERVALASGPVAGQAVVEVGPGRGSLTRALLDAGADPVIAIELDGRLVRDMQSWPETAQARLRIFHADALSIDWRGFGRTHAVGSARVIANLPYRIAGRLIVEWLDAGRWRQQMAVMVQREVAQRLCALPGSAQYGRLSVLVQARLRPKIAFTLPPGAFHPPPKVDSALVVMEPVADDGLYSEHWQHLLAVTASVFGQRRKMLRASLRSLLSGADPAVLLESAGIAATRRPQTLDRAEFCGLARAYALLLRPTGN